MRNSIVKLHPYILLRGEVALCRIIISKRRKKWNVKRAAQKCLIFFLFHVKCRIKVCMHNFEVSHLHTWNSAQWCSSITRMNMKNFSFRSSFRFPIFSLWFLYDTRVAYTRPIFLHGMNFKCTNKKRAKKKKKNKYYTCNNQSFLIREKYSIRFFSFDFTFPRNNVYIFEELPTGVTSFRWWIETSLIKKKETIYEIGRFALIVVFHLWDYLAARMN